MSPPGEIRKIKHESKDEMSSAGRQYHKQIFTHGSNLTENLQFKFDRKVALLWLYSWLSDYSPLLYIAHVQKFVATIWREFRWQKNKIAIEILITKFSLESILDWVNSKIIIIQLLVKLGTFTRTLISMIDFLSAPIDFPNQADSQAHHHDTSSLPLLGPNFTKKNQSLIKFDGNTVYSHPNYEKVFHRKYLPHHRVCAVVAIAKFCSDFKPCNWIATKYHF